MIPRVFLVTASSIRAALMLYDTGSMFTNTGGAPTSAIISAVAMKGEGGGRISSPPPPLQLLPLGPQDELGAKQDLLDLPSDLGLIGGKLALEIDVFHERRSFPQRMQPRDIFFLYHTPGGFPISPRFCW